MAVKDWTRGQLIVFWFTLGVLSLLIAVAIGAMLGGADLVGLLLLWVLVFAVASLGGLSVTWRWAGRRRDQT